MIIFIKKWNIMLMMAALVLTVGGLGFCCRAVIYEPVSAVPGTDKCIIIDAGHGEPDGGAVGKNGELEKDLNLQIARFLQGYLEQSGAKVIMTRADDNGLFDKMTGSIRQKKRSDLNTRVKMINEPGVDLCISIHMNKFTDSRYSGPQVFYSTNQESSKVLAQIVQSEMIGVLEPASKREIKPGNDIYLLKHAKVPAILVECGFLSNPEEAEKLQDTDYQNRVAWSLYCGIIKYLTV